WLDRIEKLTKPRNQGILNHPIAHAFTGLLLVILGIALSLPLPLTNYPFGLVLLAFAFALIERDGRLMILAWIAGIAEIAMIVGFSSQIVALVSRLFS
ncbi:MAG: exopolysaccharide biosynthesis protein, partial [Gammaproteobacteria bacterium]|nr:exopolysaccharide biosynthesis protein [Gammaproteobacteria bacterium]